MDQAGRGRMNEMWKAVLEGYARAGAVVDGKRVYFKVDWGSDVVCEQDDVCLCECGGHGRS